MGSRQSHLEQASVLIKPGSALRWLSARPYCQVSPGGKPLIIDNKPKNTTDHLRPWHPFYILEFIKICVNYSLFYNLVCKRENESNVVRRAQRGFNLLKSMTEFSGDLQKCVMVSFWMSVCLFPSLVPLKLIQVLQFSGFMIICFYVVFVQFNIKVFSNSI